MSARELHREAERLRHEAGLLDDDGLVRSLPVDVERIARSRKLAIIGSETRGRFRLPPRRKGEIRIHDRHLVVKSSLLDDDSREMDLFEVVAHEVGHDALHSELLAQPPLPFGHSDFGRLSIGRMAFGTTRGIYETEAIYLGALVQVPFAEMRRAIASAVERYALAVQSVDQGASASIADRAAVRYRRDAEEAIVRELVVKRRVAKIALDYWNAAVKPRREWIKEVLEARKTSLR